MADGLRLLYQPFAQLIESRCRVLLAGVGLEPMDLGLVA
jgi:hypothetical protein